jgi:hypothetical protein
MMNLEVYNVMKKIILVVGVVMLVILLAGSAQAETITATVTDNCRPSQGTFSVPAGQIATNFVLQDLKAGTKCGTGMFIDDYGWTIYSGNVNGPIVYSLSNKVDLSGTRRKSEPYGPLNTLSLGPGTYMAYVDGGKLAYVKVNYELISVNIPSNAGSGEVDPPCSNDAFLLEPIMTKEYAAGPVLEAGTYKIWSGKQNSDGSIAWKAIGPVQLKAKTSYVFDLPNRVLGEFNPINVKLYPSQAVVTLKCVHEDHYSVCFEKIQSAVVPDKVASMPGATNLALHKLASQSSTETGWLDIKNPDDPALKNWYDWDAPKGVDGVKMGDLPGAGFLTANEKNPWWQVDLGARYDLDYALLYNRQSECCMERVRSLEVLLSDNGQNWQSVYKHDGSIFGADGHPLKVDLNGQKARFLRVQLRETNWLNLNEVEVFG